MTRARILLADDHPMMLEGIRTLLEKQFDVVGLASDGAILVKEALRLHPELLVLDVAMPVLNGIAAAREIRKSLPTVKFLFLSMHASALYVRKAVEAGASGYVLKSGMAEELVRAIEVIQGGGTYFSSELDPKLP